MAFEGFEQVVAGLGMALTGQGTGMADGEFREKLSAIELLSDEKLASLRFVDVEASGLHDGSYPIEIAWCGLDLEPVSMLLRPAPNWGEEDWNRDSEKVHGIPRERLLRDGVPLRDAAEAMARALRGRMVFSDAPGFDARWLNRMFREAGVRPGFVLLPTTTAAALCARRSDPPIGSMAELFEVVASVDVEYRHTHRAGDDCRRLAAQCRALADSAWRAGLGKPSR